MKCNKVCYWNAEECDDCPFNPIVTEETNVKPPIGIMPLWMHNLKRLHDLREAIVSYMQNGMYIPIEWIEEYNDLNQICKTHEEDQCND